MVVTVNAWSGPRSLSTALLYSFSNRPDTQGADEPLYGAFLTLHPRILRPYREEVLKQQECDGDVVCNQLRTASMAKGKAVVYAKHMAKQILAVKPDALDNLLRETIQVILIRDPVEIITSWAFKTHAKVGRTNDCNKVAGDVSAKGSSSEDYDCSLSSMGLIELVRIFERTKELQGTYPVVVDAGLLRKRPRAVLTQLCDRLGISASEQMLQAMMNWEAGPKEVDGSWASQWYADGCWLSTGFKEPAAVTPGNGRGGGGGDDILSYDWALCLTSAKRALTEKEREVLEIATPLYRILRAHAIAGDVTAAADDTNIIDGGSDEKGNSSNRGSALNTKRRYSPNYHHHPTTGAFTASDKAWVPPETQNVKQAAPLPGPPPPLPPPPPPLCSLDGRVVPRSSCLLSAMDAAVQGGDACWEGLRVYGGCSSNSSNSGNSSLSSSSGSDGGGVSKVFMFGRHLTRLKRSAKTLGFKGIPSDNFIAQALQNVLIANGMSNEAHVRLTLTRGVKSTSSMNPKANVFGCTLVMIPEHKSVGSITTYNNNIGITLITSSQRRSMPYTLDSKIHHNNMLNNILAKIQANNAGTHIADALMLDDRGFVAETNATNVFVVLDGCLMTPFGVACLPGITRGLILELVNGVGWAKAKTPLKTTTTVSSSSSSDKSGGGGGGSGGGNAAEAYRTQARPPPPSSSSSAAAASSAADMLKAALPLGATEADISLSQVYCADEVFTTGSMGELSPVVEVDGRMIGDGKPGQITLLLQKLFRQRILSTPDDDAESLIVPAAAAALV